MNKEQERKSELRTRGEREEEKGVRKHGAVFTAGHGLQRDQDVLTLGAVLGLSLLLDPFPVLFYP